MNFLGLFLNWKINNIYCLKNILCLHNFKLILYNEVFVFLKPALSAGS